MVALGLARARAVRSLGSAANGGLVGDKSDVGLGGGHDLAGHGAALALPVRHDLAAHDPELLRCEPCNDEHDDEADVAQDVHAVPHASVRECLAPW